MGKSDKNFDLTENMISEIISLTKKELEEHRIVNEIIRDDVFSILDSHCIILYYPLDDENINGYHISRIANEEELDFVFINTANTTEKQVFAAAHELGHILKIDNVVCEKFGIFPDNNISEVIINRFAAELLMPKEIFIEKTEAFIENILEIKDNKISKIEMVFLTTYLMNEFLVEYTAIVRRFSELGKISKQSEKLLLDFKENSNFNETIMSIAKGANFTRLFTINRNKSINNLRDYLSKAIEGETLSQQRLNNLYKIFDIKQQTSDDIDDSENDENSIDFVRVDC